MRHFYVIANYAKPHTLFCVQEIKEYLTAKGAECVIAGPAASDNGRYHYTDTGPDSRRHTMRYCFRR